MYSYDCTCIAEWLNFEFLHILFFSLDCSVCQLVDFQRDKHDVRKWFIYVCIYFGLSWKKKKIQHQWSNQRIRNTSSPTRFVSSFLCYFYQVHWCTLWFWVCCELLLYSPTAVHGKFLIIVLFWLLAVMCAKIRVPFWRLQ